MKCVYCGGEVRHSPTSEFIYGQDYGPVWFCSGCGAYVGCYRDGSPLGTPANREDRELRRKAHAAFDPLWRALIIRRGVSWERARTAGYKWLAREMGKSLDECHIGMMHGEDLRRVIECCTSPYGLGDREVKKKPLEG